MNHHRWRFPKSGEFGEWSVGLLKGKEERGGVEVQGRRSQQGLAAECQACPEALVSLRTRLYLTALGQARFSLLISDQRKHKGKGAGVGGGAPLLFSSTFHPLLAPVPFSHPLPHQWQPARGPCHLRRPSLSVGGRRLDLSVTLQLSFPWKVTGSVDF